MRQITSMNSQSPDSIPRPRQYHSELSGEPGTTTTAKMASHGTGELVPYDCRHGPLTVCFCLSLIKNFYLTLQCLQMTFWKRTVQRSARIAQAVKKKKKEKSRFVYIAFYSHFLRKWFCSSQNFTFAFQIQCISFCYCSLAHAYLRMLMPH